MAETEDVSLPGMAFMMECYEDELKRPIRNLVNGRLLRTILIQVHPFDVKGKHAFSLRGQGVPLRLSTLLAQRASQSNAAWVGGAHQPGEKPLKFRRWHRSLCRCRS